VSIDPEERRLALDQITEGIIGCVHQVSNALGSGFLEKNCVNALAAELERTGLGVAKQHRNEVRYRDVLVGGCVADPLVEDCVIVQVKAVISFEDIHTAPCLNCRQATGRQACLLVNFRRIEGDVKAYRA
jgi:GxxExxY protein